MSTTMTIDTSAIVQWADMVRSDAPARMQKEINLALKNGANLVQRQEAKEMPRGVTNMMTADIRQIVTTENATIGPDPGLDYPLYVELGTKPHMPPVESITEWANSRGIDPWALAKSIAKKGTAANDFVGRTFEDTSEAVIEEFVTAGQSILDFLASA